MAAKVCEAVACIIVDSDGDYGAGKDLESAKDNYESTIQPLDNVEEGFRVVWCKVNVPVPEAVELTGDVPAHGMGTLNVQ